MFELTYNEIIKIEGGAPTKDTSFVYDAVYYLTRAIIWIYGEGDEVNKHLISGSAKHPGS